LRIQLLDQACERFANPALHEDEVGDSDMVVRVNIAGD